MPNDPTHREDDSVAVAIEAARDAAAVVMRQYLACTEEKHDFEECQYGKRDTAALNAALEAIAEAARREQTAARPAEGEVAHSTYIAACGCSVSNYPSGRIVTKLCVTHATPPTPEPAPSELSIPRESKTVAGPVVQSERTAPLFLEQPPEPAPRRMMGNEQHHDATHRSEHDEHDVLCQNWSTHPPCQPLPEPVDGVD